MKTLIMIASGMAGLFLLGTAVLLPLRIKATRELRRKSCEELEELVFRYERRYFDSIGPSHPDVLAFRDMTERKDLQAIRKQWKRLSSSFMELERAAGHQGRPLIMDYYHWYELDLRELNRRGT